MPKFGVILMLFISLCFILCDKFLECTGHLGSLSPDQLTSLIKSASGCVLRWCAAARTTQPVQSWSLLPPGDGVLAVWVKFGLFLHLCPLGVIVRKFVEVRPHDFAHQDRIIAGKIRHWVIRPVGEFGVHACAELLDSELHPVDS